MTPMPRKRGPPATLRIDTPGPNPHIALALGDSSASALSSATSDSDYSPFNPLNKARSLRNMKNLSLTLPSAESSSNSLSLPSESQSVVSSFQTEHPRLNRPRRPSVISLPSNVNPTAATLYHRKEEDGSPAVPYAEGPTQIIPGIWLGSEDNARDWKGLIERGIRSILNVAQEVVSPFDTATSSQPLRGFASAPNLNQAKEPKPTYHPPHLASGRPSMHYLKLQWSHGQQDLVEDGLPAAMSFTDAAVERGDGVLIHCQCGISRSATLVIALVMRAAAERSPSVPSEIWVLKGMQGAYAFVKEKSKWISPNMSLIYQLLDYERKLKGADSSSTSARSSVIADEEAEWGRRRRMLDESASEPDDDEQESTLIMREAQALDKAMEDRIVARKTSGSSIASSGAGMGPAWRSRYGSRKRSGSIASNTTNGSILSEDLVEEDEEQELLGIGGGFDCDDQQRRSPSVDAEGSSSAYSPDDDTRCNTFVTPSFAPVIVPAHEARPLPSPPPATTPRSNFELPLQSTPVLKRPRPLSLGPLPPALSSPAPVTMSPMDPTRATPTPKSIPLPFPFRPRVETRKPIPPPLHLRSGLSKKSNNQPLQSTASTPSQTLFVFPPSPTLTTRTPSTMTLTSTLNAPVPFPSASTPRISTFRAQGRTRSFIGLGAPPTPTTACSRVDVSGWVGLQ